MYIHTIKEVYYTTGGHSLSRKFQLGPENCISITVSIQVTPLFYSLSKILR